MTHVPVCVVPWRLAPSLLGTVLLGLVFAGVAPAWARAQQTVFLTELQALKLAFPDAERVRTVPIRLSAEQIRAIEESSGVQLQLGWTRCFQGSSALQIVGYACIDNMIGKYKPITYIIRIDHPAGSVARVELMEYRESIGAEVGSPLFTGQYVGKHASDPVTLKGDIRNISGATLSARGLTNGVRKILHLYESCLKHLAPL